MRPLSERIRDFLELSRTPTLAIMTNWADLAQTLEEYPRDEHHTMSELYAYRAAYHAHAARLWAQMGIAVRSRRHHDGELCFGGGWFIVAANLHPHGWVTNHYAMDDWDLFAAVPEVERGPEWDGHTPAMALERLRAALIEEGK